MKNETMVWVKEEYGYRYWRWMPCMTIEELCYFWQTMDTIPTAGPTGFPGTWEEVEYSEYEEEECISAHIHGDDDSNLYIPGEGYIYHAGYRDPEY